MTWPRTAYLTGRLPALRDVSSYVWDLWWVTRQVTHLANPWFTSHMAAPAGIQLGFDTTMPLADLIMTPVTLAFGPSASLALLTAITPGLACYAMYRAARLWLRSQAGAIAAGAFFGLSTMLTFQNWYHLNISVGALFLPMALEASVRLRRCPGRRQGIILGLVLGASVLVNLETAIMALGLAVLVLVPWLLRAPASDRLTSVALGAVVGAVTASPQIIAMAYQARIDGTAGSDVHGYVKYTAELPGLFGPSPRVAVRRRGHALHPARAGPADRRRPLRFDSPGRAVRPDWRSRALWGRDGGPGDPDGHRRRPPARDRLRFLGAGPDQGRHQRVPVLQRAGSSPKAPPELCGDAGSGAAGRPSPGHRLGAGVADQQPGRHPLPESNRVPFRLPGGPGLGLPAGQR